MASTVKVMGVPVTTDWPSGCRVILGGSTVRKDLTVKIDTNFSPDTKILLAVHTVYGCKQLL